MLVFTTPPSGVIQDVPFTVVLELQDEDGNPVDVGPVNVTISLAAGFGDLSGTLVKPLIGGVVTFDDLVLGAIGAHVLHGETGLIEGNTYNVDSDEFTVESAVDPDAQDYFDRIVTNSGTMVAGEQAAYNNLVVGLKSAGLWTKHKEIGLFGGNFAAAMVKLKYPVGVDDVLVNSGFVSGQYNRFAGLASDGANDLSTGVIPSDHGMTGADQAVWIYFSTATGTNISLGAGSIYYGWANTRTAFMSGANPTLVGQTERLMVMTTDTTNIKTYVDGGTLDKTEAMASTDADAEIRVMSYGGSFIATGVIVQGYGLATGLSAADVTALSGLLDTFMGERVAASTPAGMVFFGDSITVGQGATMPSLDYASLVSASLGVTQLNSGISGTTLQSTNVKVAGTDGRTSWYSRVSCRVPLQALIQYGVNDINQLIADGYTSANFATQLGYDVDKIRATTGLTANKICIGSPSWFTAFDGDGDRTIADAYAAAAEAVATAKGTRFADCYAAIRDGGGAALLADGLHPNDAGHAVMAAEIIAAFA
jgi:lysophospholipase L1-like esterase